MKHQSINFRDNVRELVRLLLLRRWGCLFWEIRAGNVRGEFWGSATSLEEFAEEARDDFKRWGVHSPFVLIGPAWRIRIVKWALRRNLSASLGDDKFKMTVD
jgi:hypothetical protein